MGINNPSTNSITEGIDDPNAPAVGGGINAFLSATPSSDFITWGDGTNVTWGDGTQAGWSS